MIAHIADPKQTMLKLESHMQEFFIKPDTSLCGQLIYNKAAYEKSYLFLAIFAAAARYLRQLKKIIWKKYSVYT